MVGNSEGSQLKRLTLALQWHVREADKTLAQVASRVAQARESGNVKSLRQAEADLALEESLFRQRTESITLRALSLAP